MSATVGFGEVGRGGENAALQRDGADVEIVGVDEKIPELYLAVSHEDGFLEDGKTVNVEPHSTKDKNDSMKSSISE